MGGSCRIKSIGTGCGHLKEGVKASTRVFPLKVTELTHPIPVHNEGLLLLFHNDSGHNNIAADDEYKILGVIDWESAFVVPWEVIDFPSTLWMIKQGRQKTLDRKDYVDAIGRVEDVRQIPPLLSNAGQDLVHGDEVIYIS